MLRELEIACGESAADVRDDDLEWPWLVTSRFIGFCRQSPRCQVRWDCRQTDLNQLGILWHWVRGNASGAQPTVAKQMGE